MKLLSGELLSGTQATASTNRLWGTLALNWSKHGQASWEVCFLVNQYFWWYLLYSFPDMNVRLSREDLRAFDREENAIALPDGSGYIGTLNVYHELHCIVSVP